MDFVFKRTNELSTQEIEGIAALFEAVFGKQRSVETHLAQFVNNPLGYSYHSFIKDDEGAIVGINSYVPVYYLVNGQKYLFANSIDSMIAKKYRDFFAFKEMVDLAYSKMKEEGVVFVYGYPNDNAYPVLVKSRMMKPIGKMWTYCLPLHVGGIKPALKVLNPLSELFCRAYAGCASLFASSKKTGYLVEKEHESYNASRYKRGDGKYNIVDLGHGVTVYYKIKLHEGVRTAFIIDLSEKSSKAFNKAVKYIISHHREEFDILIYPGFLPFLNTGMIRIPRKFEPKNFNLTGKLLDKKALPKEIWEIKNWDTNLSNYDLI